MSADVPNTTITGTFNDVENAFPFTKAYSLGDFQTVTMENVTTGVRPPEGCVVLSVKPGTFIPWDNPDNLISRQVEVMMDKVESVIFLPILFSISIPCNTLNMIVFCRQGLKERVNLCLFSLSLVDSIYMLLCFALSFHKLSAPFTKTAEIGVVMEFIMNNHLMFIRGMTWVSGFLSTVIACERCFCVFSPLRSQHILKTRTTAIIIVVGVVVVLGKMYIVTSRWGVACVFNPVTHAVFKTLYPSQFYLDHKKLVNTVTGLVTGLLMPVFYMSVVTTTTILTFIKLRKMVQWREQASSATLSSREIALTRMLIGISVLFVLCSLPALVLGMSLYLVPDISPQGRYFNTYHLMMSVFELSTYINASFNFFVYYFLGSKFKNTLKGLLLCCNVFERKRKTGINEEKT